MYFLVFASKSEISLRLVCFDTPYPAENCSCLARPEAPGTRAQPSPTSSSSSISIFQVSGVLHPMKSGVQAKPSVVCVTLAIFLGASTYCLSKNLRNQWASLPVYEVSIGLTKMADGCCCNPNYSYEVSFVLYKLYLSWLVLRLAMVKLLQE